MTMTGGRRSYEDLCYERRILAAYGPLCESFFYTRLIRGLEQNWDRTSRQTAIQSLTEAQPLYLQPESARDGNAILIVNANGRGVGQLEARIAAGIAKSLREGRQWHAHVRHTRYVEETQSFEATVMLLLMVTPERYAELIEERNQLEGGEAAYPLRTLAGAPATQFSVEWTVVALILIGVAITML